MAENPFARDPAVTVGVGADTSGFGSAIDGAIDTLGNFKGAIAGAGFALGALAAGGLAKATSAAADFEEQMVEVEKVTDPETAREMGDAIQDMASEMPVAHEELSNIAATAGRLGVEGTENIKDFTRVTSEMAVATDLAAEDAADSFARMSTLLEEPIENVRAMGDAINELSNNMAASSSEIVDAATRSSGVLTQLGLSSEEVLGLNAAMNEVSSSSRIAGTQLRRFGQEIQDPKKVSDLAAALGMTEEEFRAMRDENPNELIQQMAQTFGEGGEAADALRSTLSTTSRQTLAGLSQNMESLVEAQGMANEQFEEGGSLTEEYEAASSTFNSELQVTKNRVQNIAISIGENLLPVAADLLGHVNELLTRFSEWNEETNGMAGTISLVAGALGGFAVAGASVVSMLGGATAIVGALGSALAVLTGPIGIAIAAIALLAGAWTSNVFGIRDKTRAAFTAVSRIVQDRLAMLREFVEPVIQGLTQVWNQHGDEITQEIDETMTHIQNVIRDVVEFLRPYVQAGLDAIRQFWANHGDSIMTIIEGAWALIRVIAMNGLDVLLTAIRVVLNLIQGNWGEAWEAITGLAERMLDRVTEYAEEWGPKFKDALVELIKGAGEAAADAFKNAFNEAVPDELSVPSATIAGRTIGGGSIGLPQLDTGGYIEDDGLAMLHAGERVVPAAQVDRGGEKRVVEERRTVQENEVVFRGEGPLTQAMAEQANQQMGNQVDRQRRGVGN